MGVSLGPAAYEVVFADEVGNIRFLEFVFDVFGLIVSVLGNLWRVMNWRILRLFLWTW